MSLSKLEVAGIYAAISFGLTGFVLSTLSYLSSRKATEISERAFQISEATASAKVQIVGAYVRDAPTPGKFLILDVELQNFGQASAEKIRGSFFSSELPFRPGMVAGLQGTMPPGFKETLTLSDMYKWPATQTKKNVAFWIRLSFVDASIHKKYESETAYYVSDFSAYTSDGRIALKPMNTF